MGIKKYKPTTPSRRSMTGLTYEELTAVEPHKSLTIHFKDRAGRNNLGRIAVRHKGAGHKKLYRVVDFRFEKMDIPAVVETLEYDPFRSAFIALVCYRDGERRYVLAHTEMKVGDEFTVSRRGKPVVGNRMEIGNIPTGMMVYNVEMIV